MRLFIIASLLAGCGGQITPPDGGSTNDAATQGDGCVDLGSSAFGTSCNTDPDCIAVYAGTLCPGYNCICPGTAISATSGDAYYAILSKIPKGTGPFCNCPAFGSAHCISSQCVFCPNPALSSGPYPPGCPDGG